MVNAQVLVAGRLPLASVMQLPVVLSLLSSHVTLRVLFGGKLLPVSVMVLPTVPAVAFRLMSGPTE